LHRAGFANRAEQQSRDDGLILTDVLITAALRCAPPGNKPTAEQMRRCAPYLREELEMLPDLRVVVGLGAIGTRAAYDALTALGCVFPTRPIFAHGAESRARREGKSREITLIASYHPSRQNTNTRLLTEPMLDAIFSRVRVLIGQA
jgi:uracil-DNA glycosylase family 4